MRKTQQNYIRKWTYKLTKYFKKIVLHKQIQKFHYKITKIDMKQFNLCLSREEVKEGD